MFVENLRTSLRSLWAHKLRSFLTVLSITIGAAAIVAMTSLAQSGLATLTKGIEEIGGTRFIAVWADAPKKAKGKEDHYPRRLTFEDKQALAGSVPNLETIVATIRFYNSRVSAGGQTESRTVVIATEQGYFSAYKMKLAAGRALSDADIADKRRVCVIGDKLREKLWGDATPESVLGREVRFRSDRFRVVGVLQANQRSGVNLGYDWDEIGVIPITAPGVGSDVEEISMTVKRTQDGDLAIRVANAVMLHRHNQVDNFQIFDFGGLLKNFYMAFSIMQIVVALIASVALMIGGVGVMNIMLVTVSERMREIGLRKALGASKGMIRDQFLTESVVLTLFGAGVGVLLGIGVAHAASAVIRMMNSSWVTSFSYEAVGVAFAASALIGVFFGWYPASRAAEAEPIVCLKHE